MASGLLYYNREDPLTKARRRVDPPGTRLQEKKLCQQYHNRNTAWQAEGRKLSHEHVHHASEGVYL